MSGQTFDQGGWVSTPSPPIDLNDGDYQAPNQYTRLFEDAELMVWRDGECRPVRSSTPAGETPGE